MADTNLDYIDDPFATPNSATNALVQQINKKGGIGSSGGGAPTNPITFTGSATGLSCAVSSDGYNFNGTFFSGSTVTDHGSIAPALQTINYGATGILDANAGAYGANFGALTSFSAPSVALIVGGFTPTIPAATTLSLPNLSTVVGDFHPTAGALTSVNLTSLVYVGGNFSFTAAVGLTSLSLPNYTGDDFGPTLPGVTSISLPAYTTGGIGMVAHACTSLSLPVWQTDVGVGGGPDGGLFADVPVLAQALNFPALQHLDFQWSDGNYALVPSFAFPAIITMLQGVDVTTAASCTSVTLGSTLKSMGASGAANFIFTGAKLSQASVNGVLESLAALDGTGDTTAFSNATVDLSGGTSATPGAAGLTAKATLVGRGCTVTTN